MVDFDPLHQPGNDHVLCFRVGFVEGVCPGKQVGYFLSGVSGGFLLFFPSWPWPLPSDAERFPAFPCTSASWSWLFSQQHNPSVLR